MRSYRNALVILLALPLAACGGSEAVPPPARPTPVLLGVPVDSLPAERRPPPPLEPEPSLEERWAAPFAVVSSGRIAPREPYEIPPTVVPVDSVPRAEPATEKAEDGERTHRVESGETFFGIARRYEVTVKALAAANPEVDPERIRPGQVLVVPRDS
jgi:nucleoid-associated protein YgaU